MGKHWGFWNTQTLSESPTWVKIGCQNPPCCPVSQDDYSLRLLESEGYWNVSSESSGLPILLPVTSHWELLGVLCLKDYLVDYYSIHRTLAAMQECYQTKAWIDEHCIVFSQSRVTPSLGSGHLILRLEGLGWGLWKFGLQLKKNDNPPSHAR